MKYGIEYLKLRLKEKYRKRKLILFVLIAILALSLLLNAGIGSVPIPISSIFNLHSRIGEIFWLIRLPRLLLAVVVGAALSVSGTVMQGLFRNPMAGPYLLGTSAGAGVGGAIGFLLGGIYSVSLLSFVGAMLPTYISYRLSKTRYGANILILILTGIAISALLSSLITLLLFLAGNQLHNVFFWLMGSLSSANWYTLLISSVPIFTALLFIGRLSTELNALALGEETASSIGINTEHYKKILLFFSSLLTSSSVAVSGIIGFVGLVIPHICRLLFGYDNRIVIPASALIGSTFMLWSDTVSRSIISPAEIPIGIVTSLVGAPFFMYLLLRRKGK
ncbi:MAG: iron ABC transporter permease [Synergistetes bacterium]|nr:iron ABC transporter permease [Synergistota bacterium]